MVDIVNDADDIRTILDYKNQFMYGLIKMQLLQCTYINCMIVSI